jgi:hypothetical protein
MKIYLWTCCANSIGLPFTGALPGKGHVVAATGVTISHATDEAEQEKSQSKAPAFSCDTNMN